MNHEEDEEIDDGELLRRINALYREASLSQALGRWKRLGDEEADLLKRARPTKKFGVLWQIRKGVLDGSLRPVSAVRRAETTRITIPFTRPFTTRTPFPDADAMNFWHERPGCPVL